ncbi:SH3 domain-containing protein [Lasiosphaeria hispida]|uniref:SH3 domain-containing protein n=1 Tax=Lasiosphaeria hispida TaxID=260671 RepID=A0AAJ0HGY9_9PEZI|nr:SH3 domain-containing protein [Lasiosphaeria hispida]
MFSLFGSAAMRPADPPAAADPAAPDNEWQLVDSNGDSVPLIFDSGVVPVDDGPGEPVEAPTAASEQPPAAQAIPQSGRPASTRRAAARAALGSGKARVLYSFTAIEDNELSATAGEEVLVISKGAAGWWLAKNAEGRLGWIPEQYVEEGALEVRVGPASSTALPPGSGGAAEGDFGVGMLRLGGGLS